MEYFSIGSFTIPATWMAIFVAALSLEWYGRKLDDSYKKPGQDYRALYRHFEGGTTRYMSMMDVFSQRVLFTTCPMLIMLV